jgi:hypothetical protein
MNSIEFGLSYSPSELEYNMMAEKLDALTPTGNMADDLKQIGEIAGIHYQEDDFHDDFKASSFAEGQISRIEEKINSHSYERDYPEQNRKYQKSLVDALKKSLNAYRSVV